jgi:hypothetical protein
MDHLGELLSVQPFWSTRVTHPVSFLIRYLSRPTGNPFRLSRVSHMGLIWHDRITGRSEIHEALMNRGWNRQDYVKLVEFSLGSMSRVYVGEPVIAGTVAVAQAYRRSLSWTGATVAGVQHQQRVPYPTRQILAIGAARSVFLRWAPLQLRHDPTRVMCSEGACTILAQFGQPYDLRDDTTRPMDDVLPEDALRTWERRGYGLTRLAR